MQSTEVTPRRVAASSSETLNPGRLVVALLLFAVLMAFLWGGFVFLRDAQRNDSVPKLLLAVLAIVWGVAGAGGFFYTMNMVVEQLPGNARRLLTPFVFVGPAVLILLWFWPCQRCARSILASSMLIQSSLWA